MKAETLKLIEELVRRVIRDELSQKNKLRRTVPYDAPVKRDESVSSASCKY